MADGGHLELNTNKINMMSQTHTRTHIDKHALTCTHVYKKKRKNVAVKVKYS